MKKYFILASLLAVMTIGCKKEQIEPVPDSKVKINTDDSRVNELRIGLASFDPFTSTSSERIAEIENFETQLENETLSALELSDVVWYSEALLNYRNANAIEYAYSIHKTFTYSLPIANGFVEGEDVNYLYNDIETDVLTYKQSLSSEYQNIILINLESEETVATGAVEVEVEIIYSSNVNYVAASSSSTTHFDKTYISQNSWIYYPSSSQGANYPICGGTSGANLELSYFTTSKLRKSSGGSTQSGWIYAPHCNGKVGIKFFTGITKHLPIEDTHTWNGRCLYRVCKYPNTFSSELINGCVPFSEIYQYGNIAVARASSATIYTQLGLNTALSPVSMTFGKDNLAQLKVWQVPYVQYGVCTIYTPS